MAKKLLFKIIFALIFLLNGFGAFSQVSPYSLSPKWMFGWGAGMNFSGGAPVVLAGNPSTAANANALEESTAICDQTGALAVYTNSVLVYNGATNAVVRNLNTADAIAANSATNGSVLIPDPAAPTTQYYLFLANDKSVGLQPNKGINYYKLTKAGAVVTVTAGPINIASGAAVDESLCAGTDGTGGYWIVSHEIGNNMFWVWHITAGGVSAVDKQSHSRWVGGTVNGSAKISKCQDRIAWTGNNSLIVYPWNRVTGKITDGADIYYNILEMGATGSEPTHGLEFSPDGTKVYHTVLGNANTTAGVLKQVNLGTGVMTVINNTGSVNGGSKELGTMQLGPDDKIYVTNVADATTGNIYVGVINTPNAAGAGCSYTGAGFLLKPANAATDPSTYRGIANIAWLSPKTPATTGVAQGVTTGTCNVYDFSYNFKTYFDANVGITPGSETWNFGDGTGNLAGLGATPTHTFPTTGGPYSVTVTFTDATCGQTWTASTTITVTCPAPVELLNFSGVYNHGNAELTWQTAMELNNDYFELQRSTDGITFQTIAKINGAGNSSSVLNYNYTDSGFSGTVVYYRLLQHDFDGTASASKIVTVSLNRTGSLPVVIMPNPFSSSFVLTKFNAEKANVLIYDMLGRIVEQSETLDGELRLEMGSTLITGSYIIQYVTGSSAYTLRVEKK
jgi:hypothetical protein